MHGKPIISTASVSSFMLFAYLYFAVLIFKEFALSLISSLFMVKFTALADGTTENPSFSSFINSSVLIASTSGTIKSGDISSTTVLSFLASNISNTLAESAICIAGAFS